MTESPAWIHPLCWGCGTRHAKTTECPDGSVWWSLQLECSVCTHQWVAVTSTAPGVTEFHPECTSCGHVGFVKLDPVKNTANGTELEGGL